MKETRSLGSNQWPNTKQTTFHTLPLDSTSALVSASGYLRKWLRRRCHYCSSVASDSCVKLQMACNPCRPDTESQYSEKLPTMYMCVCIMCYVVGFQLTNCTYYMLATSKLQFWTDQNMRFINHVYRRRRHFGPRVIRSSKQKQQMASISGVAL